MDDASRGGAVDQRARGGRRRFWLGLLIALGGVVIGVVLSTIANRLVHIGPFDRSTFAWLVVAPIWIAAPIAAGFVWSAITPRSTLIGAAGLWVALGALAAVVFWLEVALVDCGPYGARTGPGSWVIPSLIMGVLVGSGPTLSALLTATLQREGRLGLVIVSAIVLPAIWFFVVGFAFTLITTASAGCNPPF